jgi:enediyne biosynthesis protein E9
MHTAECDVLVVGSGFGAAPAILRLSEAGLRVLVLERGPRLDPARDFRQTQDPAYLRRYLRTIRSDNLSLMSAEALGGGSNFYEMLSLRAPSLAFRLTERGDRLWPEGVSRAKLDPYYETAERMLQVRQMPAEEVPKGGLAFARLMRNLGYSCDRARYAVRRCVGSGFCVNGCIYGFKETLLKNYLPAAEAAGARIETGLEAIEVRPLGRAASAHEADASTRMPARYEVLAGAPGSRRPSLQVRAGAVVLAAGTIGTAALLLRSRRNLPRLSGQLGRNIAFNGAVKAGALLADDFPDSDMFTGQSHPGMISYEFLRSHGITVAAAKPLPAQLVSGARFRLADETREPAFWGEANVDLMRRFRRRSIVLVATGLTPPRATLTLDHRGRPKLDLPLDPDLRRFHREATELLESILLRSGCRLIDAEFYDGSGVPRTDIGFGSAHPLGACRMADAPSRGVVDASGEVFGHPGLYVSDGAAIPSSLSVGPSLTILANAERIARGIAGRTAPERVEVATTAAR